MLEKGSDAIFGNRVQPVDPPDFFLLLIEVDRFLKEGLVSLTFDKKSFCAKVRHAM